MRENQHDLEGILQTFGTTARYDDEPWDGHYIGHNGNHAHAPANGSTDGLANGFDATPSITCVRIEQQIGTT
jgi:hypothetical protein